MKKVLKKNLRLLLCLLLYCNHATGMPQEGQEAKQSITASSQLLVQVLQKLKSFYRINFVYEQGLLDHKVCTKDLERLKGLKPAEAGNSRLTQAKQKRPGNEAAVDRL